MQFDPRAYFFNGLYFMKLDAFDYTLPSEMIAKSPANLARLRGFWIFLSQSCRPAVGDLPSLLRPAMC